MIGGTGGQHLDLIDFDNSEVYDSDLGRWATSGAKLPNPTAEPRATNIDGRVLIFGNIFSCEDAAQRVRMSVCLSINKSKFYIPRQLMTVFDSSRQCMIAYNGL